MEFDLLVSKFHAAEAALARSVQDGTGPDRSAALLKRCADLLDRIETHEPGTEAERKDKAFFFLRRGFAKSALTVHGRDIDIALALASDPDGVAEHSGADSDAPEDLPVAIEGLIIYVRNAAERVALIDETYRVLAVSAPTAAFYETRPVRLVGMQVAEVVGREVFESRLRARLDACLAGQPQEHYQRFSRRDDAEDGFRVFRYDMGPVTMPGGGRFALVYATDVTDVARNGVEAEPDFPAAEAETF